MRENGGEGQNTDTDGEWVESPALEVRWSPMENPTQKKKIRVGMDWTWQMFLSVLWKPSKRTKAKSYCIFWRLQNVRDMERDDHGEIRSMTAWDAWLKRMKPNAVVFMSDVDM
jgi:hypothetical protein